MAIAIDPICKMEVDTENPPGGKSEYQGTAYCFCAPGCKVAFERDPEKYLSGESGAEMPQQQPGQQRVSFISRLFGKK
jgi:YHS domain-containing protein